MCDKKKLFHHAKDHENAFKHMQLDARVILGLCASASSLGQPQKCLVTVMTHPDFGFMVFFWIGWVGSCTDVMLSPF